MKEAVRCSDCGKPMMHFKETKGGERLEYDKCFSCSTVHVPETFPWGDTIPTEDVIRMCKILRCPLTSVVGITEGSDSVKP